VTAQAFPDDGADRGDGDRSADRGDGDRSAGRSGDEAAGAVTA
jgi:hypothetical protein